MALTASVSTNPATDRGPFVIHRTNVQSSSSLVLLFGFYNASPKALNKYCQLYTQRGYDVLCLPSHLKHFAWPKLSVNFTNDLLKFIDGSCSGYQNFLIHAFSMGAYNFTVLFCTMYERSEEFSNIQDRIRCVVYDSLTIGDLSNMVNGVTQGISKNPVVRAVIPLTAWMYFGFTHKHTVKLYDRYVDVFKTKPLQVPTLFFYCRNDPMSREEAIVKVVNDWRNRFNFPITTKCWDKSKHAAHLLTHEQDYVTTLNEFLNKVPALKTCSKL